jgi:hypothetical protein
MRSPLNRRRPSLVLVPVCASMLSLLTSACSRADELGIEFFEKKVRPVLVKHCYECHSMSAKEIKGGLRVDVGSGLTEGGDSGPSIEAGEPDESLLIKAVRYSETDMQMPPSGKLPDEAIKDLEEWVRMGAPDPRSDDEPEKPKRESIDLDKGRQIWAFQPPRSTPQLQIAAWPRSEIDRYVLGGLEVKQLAPSEDADRPTLIRRLYFDLIGLPPTPEEIDEFVADDSASAIETLVDRLLASPHFGERWGRHWLDVVRFAESSGGGRSLLLPDAWRYRDYVIDSFNADKPYDQFITEQVAGDLLPASSDEQRTSQLVATAMLLLGPTNYERQNKDELEMDVVDEQLDTLGRAFLGMTIGCARCHDHKFDPIPTKDYYALAGILHSTKTLIHDNVSRWTEQPLPMPAELQAAVQQHEQQVAVLQADLQSLKASLKSDDDKIVAVPDLPGIAIDDAQGKPVGMWTKSTHTGSYVGEGYLHDANQEKGRKTITFVPQLKEGGKYEVRLAYTPGDNRATNVPVTIFHLDGEANIQVNQKQAPPIDNHFISLGTFRFDTSGQWFVMVSNTDTDGHVIVDAVQLLPDDAPVQPARAAAVAESINTSAVMADRAATQARVKELEADLKKLKELAPKRPITMAVVDTGQPHDCHVLIRGNIKNQGELAPRGVLQVVSPQLASLPPDQSGRRELAAWLTSSENPLTARVMVNRIWQHLIGVGLVRSVDNFGATGEVPSHPELLDHLAIDFMRESDGYPAWSVKKIVRRIVLSRVYQQSSEANHAVAKHAGSVDPENRLLWRMNRRRLSAESIRDAILFVSGQLDRTAGGPTLKPGPAGEYGYVFDDVRRSVYTPVLRNRLPELFEVFDFADPNLVIGRRNTSTVATQALFLLNNPFMMEQAGAAADRLLAEDGGDGSRESLSDELLVERAFRVTLGRLSGDMERDAALASLGMPANDPAARKAAWQRVFQALFSSIDFRYLQ